MAIKGLKDVDLKVFKNSLYLIREDQDGALRIVKKDLT